MTGDIYLKVLLIYGHYGIKNFTILQRNIQSYYDRRKYRFEIVVMATDPPKIPGVEMRYFSKSDGMNFLWNHQFVVREKESSDFDLLVFAEDDVLVTDDNLDYFVDHSNNLEGTEYLPGFVSYENWTDEKYLHSMTQESWNAGRPICIKTERYWAVNQDNRFLPNIHQCCLMLDRKRFYELGEKFYVKPERYKYGRGDRYLGPRESATNWIWALYYKKVWAIDDLERALILHDGHYTDHPVGPNVKDWISTIQ